MFGVTLGTKLRKTNIMKNIRNDKFVGMEKEVLIFQATYMTEKH